MTRWTDHDEDPPPGTRLKKPVRWALTALAFVGTVVPSALIGYALPHKQPVKIEVVTRTVTHTITNNIVKKVENCPDGPIKVQVAGKTLFYSDTRSGCVWLVDGSGSFFTASQPSGYNCHIRSSGGQ